MQCHRYRIDSRRAWHHLDVYLWKLEYVPSFICIYMYIFMMDHFWRTLTINTTSLCIFGTPDSMPSIDHHLPCLSLSICLQFSLSQHIILLVYVMLHFNAVRIVEIETRTIIGESINHYCEPSHLYISKLN